MLSRFLKLIKHRSLQPLSLRLFGLHLCSASRRGSLSELVLLDRPHSLRYGSAYTEHRRRDADRAPSHQAPSRQPASGRDVIQGLSGARLADIDFTGRGSDKRFPDDGCSRARASGHISRRGDKSKPLPDWATSGSSTLILAHDHRNASVWFPF